MELHWKGSMGGYGDEGKSMLKQACERKPLANMKRSQANYYKYMDGM